MKALVPNWSTETSSATTEHYMRIPDNDTEFYVYPPSDGTGYVEKITSQVPALAVYDDADLWKTTKLALDDGYAEAIMNAVLMHAYNMDTDFPGNAARSAEYNNRMLHSLGLDIAASEKESAEKEEKWQRR
jgi:hypothetical protein